MTISLSSYNSIESGLFVNIQCDYYRANASATATSHTFTFSDYTRPVTIDGNVYQPLGQLMTISGSSNEIRNGSAGISIGISGIPNTSIEEIVSSRLKGSRVVVYRAVFDPETHQLLAISGNPAGRFYGIVNNYSLEEDYNITDQQASNIIIFQCSTTQEMLSNKVSGRRTNPIDQKALYSGDVSFDRVLNLSRSNFNFGAVVK